MSIASASAAVATTASSYLRLPKSIERYFIYDFEKGHMKVHFGAAEQHKIKINVHKAISVDEEMRVLLLEYSDQEDTYHREKDMDYVRGVFAFYYDKIKAEAEEEIRLAQLDTSGVPISKHIRNFEAPIGLELCKMQGVKFIELESDSLGLGLLGGGQHPYPFNFGAICRKAGDSACQLEWYCLADENCRSKKCMVRLNFQILKKAREISAKERLNPVRLKSDAEIVEDHLKEKHWTEVLRYGAHLK